MAKLTIEQYRALKQRRAGAIRERGNKFHAEKTADGHASKKEGRRNLQLRMMQRAGLISNLREQVRFQVIPPQRNAAGKLERATYYVADFVYTDTATGQTVVEDTKGFRTRDYIMKRKLMLLMHGITILET